MNEAKQIPNSDLIDFVYSSAVKGIKEEWLESGSSKWYDYIVSLPEKELTVYTIALLDEEVNNGGFNQYFVNGYGQFSKETIESLNRIGAHKVSSILERAFYKIKGSIDDVVFRKKLLKGEINRLYEDDELDDYLSLLDDEYYLYEDDIGKLLGEYLRDK